MGVFGGVVSGISLVGYTYEVHVDTDKKLMTKLAWPLS